MFATVEYHLEGHPARHPDEEICDDGRDVVEEPLLSELRLERFLPHLRRYEECLKINHFPRHASMTNLVQLCFLLRAIPGLFLFIGCNLLQLLQQLTVNYSL